MIIYSEIIPLSHLAQSLGANKDVLLAHAQRAERLGGPVEIVRLQGDALLPVANVIQFLRWAYVNGRVYRKERITDLLTELGQDV